MSSEDIHVNAVVFELTPQIIPFDTAVRAKADREELVLGTVPEDGHFFGPFADCVAHTFQTGFYSTPLKRVRQPLDPPGCWWAWICMAPGPDVRSGA